MRFGSDIIGQEIPKKILSKMQESGVYIFYGTGGVGKYKTAIAYTQYLLCKDYETHENACKTCKNIIDLKYPDLNVFDCNTITYDALRMVVSNVSYKPFKSKFRVYIFRDFHLLDAGSQSFLLKFLEEISDYVIVILVCDDLASVLETILSRAYLIRFGTLQFEDFKTIVSLYDDDLQYYFYRDGFSESNFKWFRENNEFVNNILQKGYRNEYADMTVLLRRLIKKDETEFEDVLATLFQMFRLDIIGKKMYFNDITVASKYNILYYLSQYLGKVYTRKGMLYIIFNELMMLLKEQKGRVSGCVSLV